MSQQDEIDLLGPENETSGPSPEELVDEIEKDEPLSERPEVESEEDPEAASADPGSGPADEQEDEEPLGRQPVDTEQQFRDEFRRRMGFTYDEFLNTRTPQPRPGQAPPARQEAEKKAVDDPAPEPLNLDEIDFSDPADVKRYDQHNKQLVAWQVRQEIRQQEQARNAQAAERARESRMKAYESLDDCEVRLAENLRQRGILTDDQQEQILSFTMGRVRNAVRRGEGEHVTGEVIAKFVEEQIKKVAGGKPSGKNKTQINASYVKQKVTERSQRGESANGARAVTGKEKRDWTKLDSEDTFDLVRGMLNK